MHAHHLTTGCENGDGEPTTEGRGGIDGGYSLSIIDGHQRYVYNYVADQIFDLASDVPVPSGRHALSVEFIPTGPPRPREGLGTPADIIFFVDGEPAGRGHLPVTIPILLGLASGISIGLDSGSPVTEAHPSPFEFTGTIHRIVFDVSGEHVPDHEAEIRAALARQ